MNRRLLLSLYDRSGLGAYMPVDFKGHELQVEEHMERFVELIVRECADICEQIAKVHLEEENPIAYVYGSRQCRDTIKKHFGVKE